MSDDSYHHQSSIKGDAGRRTVTNALRQRLLYIFEAHQYLEQVIRVLLDELKKALSERMLSAELDDHLESEGAAGSTNRRNGSSRKTMLTGTSKVTLDVPRDRAGTFDPRLIAKYQRRFSDFDDKIISMYARGMGRCPI